MAVPLAQPPGARSCRYGGTWDHARRSHLEHPYLIEELRAFREELYLSDSDWEDLVAEVNSLLRKAEKGRLNFDSLGKKGVVCQCESRPSVLEIRMTTTLNFDGLVRLSRLYFSEPRDSEHVLVSLSLRHKQPGPFGLKEQDQHICQANERLNQWFRS